MTSMNFSLLVTAAVLPFESRAFESGNTLEFEASEKIELTGNKTQLEQLISILLDNAFEHCRSKGTVRVTLKSTRTKAILSVSNEGDDIPPEKAARLFERFYRADDSRSEHGGHYGLGLSIAKAVSDAHKGKLYVDSGGGFVTFTAEIPCNLKPR